MKIKEILRKSWLPILIILSVILIFYASIRVKVFREVSNPGELANMIVQTVRNNPLLFFLIVSLLALADSINPCMISLMIIMIANLFSLGLDKKKILIRAAIFTIVVYLTYLALGILIFLGWSYLYAVSIAAQVFNILKLILVLVLFISGIINIIDAFREKAVFAVPESAKGKIQSLMVTISVIATILLAVFVTLVELPCTGIFYLGLIAVLHSIFKSLIKSLPILIYYNALFILPEILITLSVWKGAEYQTLYNFYREHRKGMRLLEGILLIVMALFVYLFVKIG